MTISKEEYIISRHNFERKQNMLNEAAQGTWLTTMAMNSSLEESDTEQLVKILEEQAQHQLTSGNTQTSWVIRQHIRNISPTLINNLLQLIQLSIILDVFTPELLRDWQVVELLHQSSSNGVDSALLAQVFASTMEFFLKLDKEHLEALNYVPSYQIDTENYQKAQKLLDKIEIPFKVHLGCGEVKFDGWLNIDKDEKLDTVDFGWDVITGLPFDDECCQYIYHEHLLEHLPVEKGVMFLRECYRVLKSDGVLRVAMPSLDVLFEKVNSPDWRNQDWLTRRLKEAGFTHIKFVDWGCSEIEELKNRETRKDSVLICEAQK